MTDREEFEAWLRTPCPDDYKCDPKWAAYIWQAVTASALERAIQACKKVADKQSTLGRQFAAIECGEVVRSLKDIKE